VSGRLEGRYALVTGSGNGLGVAAAIRDPGSGRAASGFAPNLPKTEFGSVRANTSASSTCAWKSIVRGATGGS
jgi:hypothetical protein